MQRVLAPAAVVLMLLGAPQGADATSCKRRDVVAMLREFFPAYNEGRIRRLDVLFATGDRFLSYQVHPVERTGDEASERGSLIAYFRQRHDANDVMSHRDLRVGRYDNGNRGFGFSLGLRRTSDELMPFSSGDFGVKGSIDCDGIYFWNMSWSGP